MTLHEPGQDEKIPVLALLDEFGNMSRISKLKEGMSFLRSYNIRMVVIVQYLSQITSIYGRDDARGFLNTKVKIAFTLNDAEDAKFFSEALGKKAVSLTNIDRGRGDVVFPPPIVVSLTTISSNRIATFMRSRDQLAG